MVFAIVAGYVGRLLLGMSVNSMTSPAPFLPVDACESLRAAWGSVCAVVRASAGPQFTPEGMNGMEAHALWTGALGCRFATPARRDPPFDRYAFARSFVRSFLSAGLVCSASRPATDKTCQRLHRNGRLESSFYPSDLAARPARATWNQNTVATFVNKKPAQTLAGVLSGRKLLLNSVPISCRQPESSFACGQGIISG